MALHPPQQEGPARLRGERFDDAFEMPQRVARIEHLVIGYAALEHFQIGDIVDRDDHLAPLLVDQDIVRRAGDEGEPVAHLAPAVIGIGARHHLRDQIVEIVRIAHQPPQPAPQHRLIRQDHGLEPGQPLVAIVQRFPPGPFRSLA